MVNKAATAHRDPLKAGSPILLNVFAGNATVSAGVRDSRHGPWADLLVLIVPKVFALSMQNL